MSARGFGALRRGAARLRRSIARRTLVLCYHRVADVRPDPWRLCVSLAHFAEHLEVLRRCGHPTALRPLVRGLGAGTVPRRAIVVTLDDGYADNLHCAKPLLERHDVPATVFVATGELGSGREFWWDDLERVLLQPGVLPSALRLHIDGRSHQWDLGDAARYGGEAFKSHRWWKGWGDDVPTARHATFRELFRLVAPLDAAERRRITDEIVAWAGLSPTGRATHRILSPDDVLLLAAGGLLEVGAHTVSHPVLAAQPAAVQREELRRSKARLEELLTQPVVSFAYPYGTRRHFTLETAAIVQEAGFTSACTTEPGLVASGADPFTLPRAAVRDWDGDTFARHLEEWLAV